ncbi:MAG: response regulator transcription factor [Magnetospirillum sp.]|nr:response regulator transcription factor [Magnetospirillum sp.]
MTCGRCGSPEPCTPTIFVVDDDEEVRHSLAFLLKSLGTPVECHPSAEAFLAARRPDRPGCLVLDVRMPGMSGLELQALLNRAGSSLGVVFLSGHGDIPMAVDAMRGGAVVFLEKPCNDQVLLDHVADALRRSAENCGRAATAAKLRERMDSLTQRERAVMELVVQGKPNKVIAFELDISIKTVEVHRSHVMEKMAADSVADLTRMLMEVH